MSDPEGEKNYPGSLDPKDTIPYARNGTEQVKSNCIVLNDGSPRMMVHTTILQDIA